MKLGKRNEKPVLARLEEIRKEKELARRINEHYETATAKASETRAVAGDAVKEAILCGQALQEAREVLRHGQFLTWLAEHCPEISQARAYRWMRLASLSHVINLESPAGLRQAYLAAGIIPADPDLVTPEQANQEDQQQIGLQFDCVARWCVTLRRRLLPAPILSWPPDQRAALKLEMQPIVELYQQL